MPKVRWGVTGSQVDQVEVEERGQDFEPYEGPVPPKYTILDMNVERIEATKSSNDNPMVKLLLICPGDGKQAKYKGLPIWDQIVVVEQNDWKIRQFLDAIGAEGKDWDNTVTDADGNITKIGRIKTDDLSVRVSTKRGVNLDGDPRAEVGRYVTLRDDEEPGAEDTGESPF
jgi:hypothetical protein